MEKKLSWKQVLMLETFLNNFVENIESVLDRINFRNNKLVNRNIPINKSKDYSYDEARSYLLSKYAGDKLINDDEYLHSLFNSIADGYIPCNIDSKLLEFNMKKHHNYFTLDELREGILTVCDEHVGFTEFFLRILKYIIEKERSEGRITELTDDAYEKYKELIIKFDYNNENFAPAYQIIKSKVAAFMYKDVFNNYNKQCIQKKYSEPYSVLNYPEFLSALKMHSLRNVIRNLNTKVDKLIVWHHNLNFCQDNISTIYLERTKDIKMQISVFGLFNFDQVYNMAKEKQLTNYIKNILIEHGFEVLDNNTGIDIMPFMSLNSNIFSSCQYSPLRIGKDLSEGEHHIGLDRKLVTGSFWVFVDSDETLSHLDNNLDLNTELISTNFEKKLIKYLSFNLKKVGY